MAAITPTITTDDPHLYREQMERIATFADGVHIDFADGIFAPTALLPIDKAWRHDALITHAHVMYEQPLRYIDDIVALDVDLVIFHVESEDVKKCLKACSQIGLRAGIALLPESTIKDIEDLQIEGLFDHVLIFAGHLGYQGGSADMTMLDKVRQIRASMPDVEIGWDGGIDANNVEQIVEAGVSVLNVGGYIKNADDPQKAYATLLDLIQS